MKNSKYWADRFATLEARQNRRGESYYKDLQKQYREATNSIQMDINRWYTRLAENNDISYAKAKQYLSNVELEEFRWTVEQYVKYGRENAVNGKWIKQLENASARHHISYLEAMKLQLQQHAELLSTIYENGVTDFLHESFSDAYYRSAYEIAKGTSVGQNLATLDLRKIEKLVSTPWVADGNRYSERIWTNKTKLITNLHTELTHSIIRGDSPQNAIRNLAEVMEVSKRQAGKLIMTESAAISSVARSECMSDLGVEQYQIVATLDSRTSKTCRDMDGEFFDLKDYKIGENAPPFHVWCRTTTAPYFEDNGGERAARGKDGKTYFVPADMKYGEWKQKYVNNGK